LISETSSIIKTIEGKQNLRQVSDKIDSGMAHIDIHKKFSREAMVLLELVLQV